MARNYTVGEGARILAEGVDTDAIVDLSRRFPLFTHKFMTAISGDKDAVVDLLCCIPEYVSTRKVEKVIANGPAEADEVEGETEEETAEEEPKPKRRGRKAAAKKEPEPDAADDDGDDEAQDGKYVGKNAMELFKECKKRGIKAQPKKPVKYYVELLEEDDAVVESESNDSDDDDDWDI